MGIELKEDLNSVDRNISDPVMHIELRLEEVCLNAPQVGCMENEKETFC